LGLSATEARERLRASEGRLRAVLDQEDPGA
jgi:hypothetical protein